MDKNDDVYNSKELFISAYNNANGYVQSSINYLFLMNGGATLALVSFMGSALGAANDKIKFDANSVVTSIFCFVLGTFSVFCASSLAYFTQRRHANRIASGQGQRFRARSLYAKLVFVLMLISLLSFATGVSIAACSFSSSQQISSIGIICECFRTAKNGSQ